MFAVVRKNVLLLTEKMSIFRPGVEFARRGVYILRSFGIYICAFPRMIGFRVRRFQPLRKYKGIHKGERCFIVATGPSLTIDDLNKIRNEKTLSMNSIVLSYQDTEFRPTYYGIQDNRVYKKIYNYLEKYADEHPIFYSSNFLNAEYREQYRPKDNWIPVKINFDYHLYDFNYTGKWHVRFSDNIYAYAYDGYTITYTMLQLAIYMGFSEIYLLGCDSNYTTDVKKAHFVDYGIHDPERYILTAGERLNCAYKKAKEYADAHGIKIFNATRGGKLEIFPRVNLDDIV